MSSVAITWPAMGSEHSSRAGSRLLHRFVCFLIAVVAVGSYWAEIPWLVWASLPLAAWLAFESPHTLVAFLLIATPTFPVLRVVDETLGSREVSTRGLFLSVDDPIISALFIAWLWRQYRSRRPSALRPLPAVRWLLILYPAVSLANIMRLEWQQNVVSLLYYLKWAEYACLLFLIPGLIGAERRHALFRSFRTALSAGALASAGFGVYEITESIRTHTYSQAALFPRASSFFGTLDPQRFGASEDPVNFGCYLIAAGAISWSLAGRKQGFSSGTLSSAASFLGVLLSVSRAPILGAALAYLRLQRVRAGKTLLSLVGLAAALVSGAIVFPQATGSLVERFMAVIPDAEATESSATDRFTIVLNSPVFEIDEYWISGHGHSSYRFVSEQHLSSFMGRVSRSLYNFPMTVWYDAGPAGLALWVAFFFQLNRLFRSAGAQSGDPELGALGRGLQAALWGLAAASMFSEVPYNWRVMGFFYNATGVCLALSACRNSGVAGVWARRQCR